MFEIILSVVFMFIIIFYLSSLKYKKLSDKIKETQLDVDVCSSKISAINQQLDFFQETIQKIEHQITELEAKAQPKRKPRKAE